MDGRIHRAVAVPSGIGVSLLQSQGQTLTGRIVEAAGAGCAAAIGASLPDRLDPPNGPDHRSWAHSILLAAGTAPVVANHLPATQLRLRAQAAAHAQAAQWATDPSVRIWHTLCEWFYLFLSGCVVGLAVGYGSHLALDAFTPRSLPLIC